MTRFKNREEYEKWKAERLNKPSRQSPEKGQPDSKIPDKGIPTIETPLQEGLIDAEGKLPGIGDLLKRSWEIYKRRAGTLISIMLLSGILASVPVAVFIGTFFLTFFSFPQISESIMKVFGVIAGMAAGITVVTGVLAFNFAIIDESLKIKSAFKKGVGNLFSGIWLISLQGFILTGGLLLFIIPGILFLVWFIFALFVFASSDDKGWWTKKWTNRGMDALLKSKEYVRGYWFDVFLRLFIIWIILGSISIIPIIGILLSFMFAPFVIIYNYLIYQDLGKIKGDVYYPSSAGEKLKWMGAGALGYVITPAIVFLLSTSPVTGRLELTDLLKPSSAVTELEGVWRTQTTGDPSSTVTFTFKGNRLEVMGRCWFEERGLKGKIALDNRIRPKHLDIKIKEATKKDYIGETALGIYKLENNILGLCLSTPGESSRPHPKSLEQFTSFLSLDMECFSLARL